MEGSDVTQRPCASTRESSLGGRVPTVVSTFPTNRFLLLIRLSTLNQGKLSNYGGLITSYFEVISITWIVVQQFLRQAAKTSTVFPSCIRHSTFRSPSLSYFRR